MEANFERSFELHSFEILKVQDLKDKKKLVLSLSTLVGKVRLG
jgi:hypothetical protein